ncbi:1-acyl-sn-glycerol-3-phosphate acyltransferase [Marinobacter daqiaonensis]|uniref:1-acyl-sn-glycerol-3-phosphate acyltransferase n=1 Tax=Marinobacter daqiaonensis TaxID=650891 RepID=A0A1I6J6D6_9GAMM|nr:1-acyl-sn-glycerol-3-phosphate acyltransferase [Marinobacter daqiaonensis]SFR74536.1 1-acyl-sn-glycerol-3-phosphate acyltransferase [Marinobacter daqiaonensis]
MGRQNKAKPQTRTLAQRIAMALINLAGWRVPPFPDVDKSVVVGGPHTSNWDGVIGLTAAVALGVEARFLIKHNLFRGPLGWLLRRLGGVPVDRSKPGGVVGQAAREMMESDRLILAVTPEGTRSGAARWKTGFHHIALRTGVPIVVTVIDYRHKELRFPLILEPTEDLEADLERIYECFASVTPKHPEKLSEPVRVRYHARSAAGDRETD